MASHTSSHQNIQQSPTDRSGPKQTTIDLVGGILCKICRLTFATKQTYDSHYRSHGASTDIIYTCNICYKEIVGYPSFRGHCYTSHVIKERFQCEHCLKQFSKISNLKDHVNKIHKFKCPTCRKEFPSKKEMLLHKIIHNNLDQPPYNCNTCNIEIDTADECKSHVEKHLKFLYSCPICNDNISNKDSAAEHMKTHFDGVISDDSKEPPQATEDVSEELSGIMCQFCSLVLGDRVKFDAHFSCEHGDEDIVYMCVECGKSFEKYSVFKSHCNDHTLRNRYKCEICKKAFPRLSMLAAHTAACQAAGAAGAGAARGKVFACPACGRRFASMGRWREHLRLAHGLQRHLPCPHHRCDLVFDTPKQLILHQQTHDITDQNFCSQCRLVFPNVASCERHIDMHRKKIFFCPICKRNAKDKKVILNHLSKHFEVISHLCRICGKIYNTKKCLIEHLKSHKKVKSYSCTHCHKSFLKPYQLEQHVNTHTGVKPYKCPVCVKSFSNYPNWVKHVRRMHHEESIYIKNPIIEPTDADFIDKEDHTVKTTNNENNVIKYNNVSNNDIYADNKKNNNNYQVSNTNEQVYNMHVERSINEVHHIENIDIQHLISDDIAVVNNKESTLGIVNDEKYEKSDMTKMSHENFFDIDELNDINNINVGNQIVDQTTKVENEVSLTSIATNEENGEDKNCQKEDLDLRLIADEQILNTRTCDKPHKCPICEKSFAKYSYMSTHVRRVHHIRSIDIKNLMVDQKENDDSESHAMDPMVNVENEASIDNAKRDIDEQLSNTEKLKIQMTPNIECNSDDSKPHKCTICDKSFAKYPYMTKHVRKVHNKKGMVDVKNTITDQKLYNDETSMETGVDEDTETNLGISKDNDHSPNPENQIIDKPHKCHICEKSFAKYPYMTKHIRKIHTKKIIDKESVDEVVSAMESSVDGEYEISIDNAKRNNRKDNIAEFLKTDKLLNLEQLTNIEIKPYKCPTCDKSFAKHSYMSRHIRTVHNKKSIDVKNLTSDHKDSVDDDGSAMETVDDEENDIFTDNSKDDNDDRISITDAGYKPYKCPMCEKSFAKDRYCMSHVRRVHYKNGVNINCEIEASNEKENQIVESHDYLQNEISNIDLIASIVNDTETTDCLTDIDDANASMDFANIRLENYIFSIQRDNPMDIVPSMPDATYLLKDCEDGNVTSNKDLFKDNNGGNVSIRKDTMYDRKLNVPLGTELFNENGEAIALVEKDLFNANSKEGGAAEKDLFSGNNDQNDNPIDILEFIAEMPENNSLFVPVINQEVLTGSASAAVDAASYTCGYGPEYPGGFDPSAAALDLDDHMLPHIDPLLTINDRAVYPSYDTVRPDRSYCWQPPVITKPHQYAGYDAPDAARVPVMNTDIF